MTRDKANRHFFFTGDTGSGKTTGTNGLLAALVSRNPTLGGVVMAKKGDEWFYLEWLACTWSVLGHVDSIQLAQFAYASAQKSMGGSPGTPLVRLLNFSLPMSK